MHRTVFALIAVASVVAPLSVRAQGCLFSAERNKNVDVANIDRVVIAAGAGSLRVTGKSGARQVQASGKACASSQDILAQIDIKVRTDGRVLRVEAVLPELRNDDAYLDLTVTLPDNLPVQAADSSGDAELRALKELTILDSSGDLVIADIAGLARVQDSSGDVRLEQAGSVDLQDSSGDVVIRQVKNDVEIPSDSSGNLTIDDVGGAVRIVADSSGDIRVSQVRGNVEVVADSSGDITAREIGGDFTVSSDTSGSIDHENVKGRVELPADT
jgi:hypothetical protein